MTDIKIYRPMIIDMKIVEIDDYIPSIKMLVNCRIEHPTGSFVYQANDIWFDCSKWDEFVDNLSKIEIMKDVDACLPDMSEYFEIKIVKNSYKLRFIFNCNEPNVGDGHANISFSSPIDFELLKLIKKTFSDFHKWW
jgi:hypothetical protein